MPSDELSPKPEPRIEPGEPNPGGVDAIDGGDAHAEHPTIPNLPTDKNPAVHDATPESMKDEMKAGEDTSTQATHDGDHPMEPEEESPA